MRKLLISLIVLSSISVITMSFDKYRPAENPEHEVPLLVTQQIPTLALPNFGSTSTTMVAFHGSISPIPNCPERILYRGFYNISQDGRAFELRNKCFENEENDGIFIINRGVKIVYLTGSSRIGCDIVFPDGVQGCSVIREENTRFTGEVVNGTLSTTILPSSEESCSCCMQ